MKTFRFVWAAALLAVSTSAFSSCQNNIPSPTPGTPGTPGTPSTPATAIPDALVGTWYAENNASPLTTNWNQGTFQGSPGFAEFRTMVFTKNGTGAEEYHSDVYTSGTDVEQRLCKMTGTLEYDASATPARLTFHAQSGTVRVFSNKYAGYKESPIVAADVAKYKLTWSQPQASTFATSPNHLTANLLDGATAVAVKYKQVPGTGITNPNVGNGLYDNPPATGTYVKIGSQYFPTATIGNHVWMTVNYVGSGGLNDARYPQHGTYYKFMDLNQVTIPAGWRIPTRQDYVALLASQGLTLDMWDATDPSDVPSKRKLGQLMAPSVWATQDGYATNSSGFTALPGDYRSANAIGNGIGSNCRLWTSSKDANNTPLGFQIFQIVGDTYAAIATYPIGAIPQCLPVRLVRDK